MEGPAGPVHADSSAISVKFFVDGGVRFNGNLEAFGACAARLYKKTGKFVHEYSCRLPRGGNIPPTSQRSEMKAINLALEQSWEILNRSSTAHRWLDVTIYSDSQSSVNHMRLWRHDWENGKWATSIRTADQDIYEEASSLINRFIGKADVRFVWLPREELNAAEVAVNRIMDEMQKEYGPTSFVN